MAADAQVSVRAARSTARRRRLAAAGAAGAILAVAGVALAGGGGGAAKPPRPPAVAPRAASPAAAAPAAPATPAKKPPAAIVAPVVRQKLHNDCEATALQILLATVGTRVGQLQLQRDFPRSRPLDPVDGPSGRVWGDPELGFVGRPDGGGKAGGYGIYPRPVAATAARHGVKLLDLTGSPASALYARLRAGHAVMAWVALSDGPYGRWRSPQGRLIGVNFGEHTVVLTRVTSRAVHVVNPLYGTRETWSRATFERRWAGLRHRALST